MVQFFTVMYSPVLMAWAVSPFTFSTPWPLNSACPLITKHAFCEPLAQSVSVFSVSFFTLTSMRLPF